MQFENSPYWKDLKPIVDSGAMQSAIDGTYRYPYRINMYPGTSCMFSCLFCGRNYDAVVKGKRPNVFSQIIQQDDGSDPDRINISGGLEPLTSPYINEICKDLNDRGYRSRMITNAFLLNDKTLSKSPYINTLHHLRVSIYGLDEQEYLSTTRHKFGWKVVKNNLANYNKRADKTKLYINYVLIPENFDKMERILNYIEDIGGIENLSLREDFTFQYEIDERNKQMKIPVDYGYALQDAMAGRMTNLMKVKVSELTKSQSPQVKICLDPNGNIYSYMEAGFIDRPGADRHALGNVIDSSIEQELRKQKQIEPMDGDLQYLDAYNHMVSKYISENR